MALGGLAPIRFGRSGASVLVLPDTGAIRARSAVAAAALLGAAAFAVATGRPLLALVCAGAALPPAVAAAFGDRRIRSAVEAFAWAVALAAVYRMQPGVAAAWSLANALAAVGLLAITAIGVEATRCAMHAGRFRSIPFWLIAALLAAASYLHLLAQSWRGLLASATDLGTEAFAYLALTGAHAGYAMFGLALVFALLARAFVAGAPAAASVAAAADRWRVIAAGGAGLAALVHAIR